MLKNILISISFILMLVSCNETNSMGNIKLNPTPDVVNDSLYCAPAEENLKRLGCPEGQPTKKGKTFTEVCQNASNNFIWFNPKCLASINSCSEIETSCAVGKK
jgi:hypothetical protein